MFTTVFSFMIGNELIDYLGYEVFRDDKNLNRTTCSKFYFDMLKPSGKILLNNLHCVIKRVFHLKIKICYGPLQGHFGTFYK